MIVDSLNVAMTSWQSLQGSSSMVWLTGIPAAEVATRAELYRSRCASGATVRVDVLGTKFLIGEFMRGGVTGNTVTEQDSATERVSVSERRQLLGAAR